MTYYNKLVIKGRELMIPIIQGGMAVGVSMSDLAGAVAREGGVGVIATAGIDRLISQKLKRKLTTFQATFSEVTRAKILSLGGLIGVNIMAFLQIDRDAAAMGAMAAGADFIFTGAGLYLDLPKLNRENPYKTAFVPIVSSAQAARIIAGKWQQNYGYTPDAFVVEGPLAGGHLGFKMDQINNPDYQLKRLVSQVKEVAEKLGGVPVIAAGGILYGSDIKESIDYGADGVQMGSAFFATVESDGPLKYKASVLAATAENIVVVENSPCGFPFRTLNTAPAYQAFLKRQLRTACNRGYLLQKDREQKYTICRAKDSPDKYFCICHGLLNSAGYVPEDLPNGSIADSWNNPELELYTIGARGGEITDCPTVKERMDGYKEFAEKNSA